MPRDSVTCWLSVCECCTRNRLVSMSAVKELQYEGPRRPQHAAFRRVRAFLSHVPGSRAGELKPGYAKFDVAEPGLNLTLNASSDSGPGALNHLGIRCNRPLRERRGRGLKAEGLATFEEENTDCCYALQDKVWVTDPMVTGGSVRRQSWRYYRRLTYRRFILLSTCCHA